MPVGVVSEAGLLLHVVADDGRAHSRWRRAPRAARNHPADLMAGDLMSSPAITTTPQASITQAATIAARAHIKVLPVVDADGRVVGMTNRAALLGAYAKRSRRHQAVPSRSDSGRRLAGVSPSPVRRLCRRRSAATDTVADAVGDSPGDVVENVRT